MPREAAVTVNPPKPAVVIADEAALNAPAPPDASAIFMQALNELRAENALLLKRIESNESFAGIGAAIAEGVSGAMQKQHKLLYKSNEEHPRVSVFSHPEGDVARQKVKFHRQPWLNGAKEDPEMLTPMEIDTYNLLSKKLTTPTSRIALREGQWEAWVDPSDRNIYLKVPCKAIEQLMNLPGSLVLILNEFINGQGTSDPMFLLEGAAHVKDLEAQIRELRAIMESGGMVPRPSSSAGDGRLLEL